ncbi:hypothetical protein [Leuconostoc mesenteroides]|uniref:hypothetical protein n=1 Tax=Leuconostoc mesenteroides TaxID=1245 RepID=UPI00107F48DF|nr:hypothetical protein [Leuconostoc mesenteroides]QXC55056.1 hypothetical protein EZV74_10230 [Leuconostoc mesenteroides]TGD34376.1 hypothetical protein EIA53_07330 [Leuconostoc mesenteroides]USI45037.1 hypothetical protein M0D19_05920 [Leuconostoc mesenteroides]
MGGLGAIISIFVGSFYRSHDKKIQIEIKGYLYHFKKDIKRPVPQNKDHRSKENYENTYFKINVKNVGDIDMKIVEAGITDKEFTYADTWQDLREKNYAKYSFEPNKEIIGKTALPLNMPWVEEELGVIITDQDAKKIKVYAIDALDNIYYGKLKFVNDIDEKIKSWLFKRLK